MSVETMLAESSRLRPVAKPSTTSAGGTAPPAYTHRADSVESRRAFDAAQSVDSSTEEYWRLAARNRNAQLAAEKAAEDAKWNAANRRVRDQEESERHQADIARRRKEFREAEALIELALSGLTGSEKGRVNTRLAAAGKLHDVDLATAFANEEIALRGDSRDVPIADWRFSDDTLRQERKYQIVK